MFLAVSSITKLGACWHLILLNFDREIWRGVVEWMKEEEEKSSHPNEFYHISFQLKTHVIIFINSLMFILKFWISEIKYST